MVIYTKYKGYIERMNEMNESKNNTKMLIGTHDSCAYNLDFSIGFWKNTNKFEILRKLSFLPCLKKKISDITLTQKYNLHNQLTMGCRVLDIRVSYKDGIFYTNHTFCCGTLDEMMQQVREFALENYEYCDSPLNKGMNSNEIYLLIKPDWQTRDTILEHEDELLVFLENKFKNLLLKRDGKMSVLCYYNARDANIYKSHSQIHKFNEFDFAWLNVDTIEKFTEKFIDQYSHRDLSNYIFNYVMTPNFSKVTKKLLTTDLKNFANDLNPLLESFIEKNNQPKFILIDFVNSKLVHDLEDHYLE